VIADFREELHPSNMPFDKFDPGDPDQLVIDLDSLLEPLRTAIAECEANTCEVGCINTLTLTAEEMDKPIVWTDPNDPRWERDGVPLPENQPQFTHDCDNCTFLGRHELTDGRFPGKYDLYHCTAQGSATVIARYGNEGEQYTSGIVIGKQYPDSPLAEALRRAVSRGLKVDGPLAELAASR
jgi:hypothetical protein